MESTVERTGLNADIRDIDNVRGSWHVARAGLGRTAGDVESRDRHASRDSREARLDHSLVDSPPVSVVSAKPWGLGYGVHTASI